MTLVGIPEDILTSIRIPKKELEKELKTDLAFGQKEDTASLYGKRAARRFSLAKSRAGEF